MFDAVIGPYTTLENAAAAELTGRLEPGMLCLADRGVLQLQSVGERPWHRG